LTETPIPNGTVAMQPGDTWLSQLGFRDLNPNPPMSFTNVVSITFH